MTEQEFRKLKALDLIQILLTQEAEVSEQQENLEKKNIQLKLLLEENDIIKAKLNDRDAMLELIKQKLNESDEHIRELDEKMKELYSDRRIALEETGSLVQAALELNKIFEVAQREAEQYIQNAEKYVQDAGTAIEDTEVLQEANIEDRTIEEEPIKIENETPEEEKTELSEAVIIEIEETAALEEQPELNPEPETEAQPETEEKPEEMPEEQPEPQPERAAVQKETEPVKETAAKKKTSEPSKKSAVLKPKGVFGFLRTRKKK